MITIGLTIQILIHNAVCGKKIIPKIALRCHLPRNLKQVGPLMKNKLIVLLNNLGQERISNATTAFKWKFRFEIHI